MKRISIVPVLLFSILGPAAAQAALVDGEQVPALPCIAQGSIV